MFFQIKNKLCPLVKDPLNECYCFDLNSKTITPAITYCGNNYKSCAIYKNKAVDEKPFERTLRNK
jgi:hypothetical protein